VVIVSICLAWAAAIAAHATGHSRVLDHDALLGRGSPSPAAVLAYAGAWIVMVTAMMLPSAVPLVRLYAVTSGSQPRAGMVLGAFVGGYVAVWTVFGWLALSFDTTVHRGVDAWPWLDAHPHVVLGVVLLLAGAFQFTGLKDRCLNACRHPAAYLIPRYRRGSRAGFRLGWDHGLFCLGCCWALMLVAFAAGMTDLRLMAGFTALMAYEKVGRYGVVAAQVAGVALVAVAAGVVVYG
jgi:predicted metal-binding membrane protein